MTSKKSESIRGWSGAGVLALAVVAASIGIIVGYGAVAAAPAAPQPVPVPSDGSDDPTCWSCPRGIYPIFVYPCATPVGMPTVPAPPGVPTLAPRPTPTPGGMASTLTYRVCPQIAGKIPAAVEVHAVAAPWEVYGYGMLRNPNVPYHPMWNSYRTWLSLRNMSVPYSRCNSVVWKAGCP